MMRMRMTKIKMTSRRSRRETRREKLSETVRRRRRVKRSAAGLQRSISTDGKTSLETDWSSLEQKLG